MKTDFRTLVLLVFVILLTNNAFAAGSATRSRPVKSTIPSTSPISVPLPTTVLVVANQNNSQSMALAQYYMQVRNIPASNLLTLNWTSDDNADTCTLAYYNANISAPITSKIASLPEIDYIVLCRNLPSKISDTTGSVDSALAGKSTSKKFNNYCWVFSPFTSKAYGMYLVTRLDGWSWADAFALVDNAQAAQPTGTFVLDEDASKGLSGGYGYYNSLMQAATNTLHSKNIPVALDNTNTFIGYDKPMGGYISWGSNDANFSQSAFTGLTFAPGAIAETLVSTSASNLRFPGGFQSQIAQLIHQGVTGIKGYVSEPYVDATADPSILFPAYISGMNLAEAFYSASCYLGWKDVVIGDPLCNPYMQLMR